MIVRCRLLATDYHEPALGLQSSIVNHQSYAYCPPL